jgi:hypothetical protein
VIGGLGADLWKIRAVALQCPRATVAAGAVHVEKVERGAARVVGRKERRPRGFAHGRQERRVFLLISCLI